MGILGPVSVVCRIYLDILSLVRSLQKLQAAREPMAVFLRCRVCKSWWICMQLAVPKIELCRIESAEIGRWLYKSLILEMMMMYN